MNLDPLSRVTARIGHALLVAGLGASLAVAQTTWYVAPTAGPGIDFTSIQTAVDSASPFDRIIVLQGVYQPFTVDKSLQVVAVTEGPGVRILETPPQSNVIVENLALGETLVLHGFGPFEAIGLGAVPGVEVNDCAGTIVLSGLRAGFLDVVSSTDVRVVNAIVGRASFSDNSRAVLEMLRLVDVQSPVDSQMTITDSEVQLVGGALIGRTDGGGPLAAIDMVDSELVLVDTLVTALGATHVIEGTGSATLVRPNLIPVSNPTPVAPGITVTNRDIARLFVPGVVPGSDATIWVNGTPSALFVTLAGLPVEPYDIGFADDLWLVPLFVGPAGSLDTDGAAVLTVPVPLDLALIGLPIAWQGATLSPISFSLTTPSMFVSPTIQLPF